MEPGTLPGVLRRVNAVHEGPDLPLRAFAYAYACAYAYVHSMAGRVVGIAAVVAAACCSRRSEVRPTSTGSDIAYRPVTFTIFGLAEMRGQIGPCGCTSDPLGDISRTVQLVEDARVRGPAVVLDA